jgi:NAD(P)-dependent dehydrogenase (short-subunit alcohol dehydrogenase family)
MAQRRPSHASLVRIALVTGANRGIGFEVCRQLAEKDFVVLLTARDAAKAQTTARKLANAGGVEALVLDVADARSIEAAVGEVAERYGRLDVLINNAGINYDTWETAENANIDSTVVETISTNLLGPWRMCQAFLPLLRKSKAARIVNVSSESGSLAHMGAGPPAYQVTKAALNALTRTLAGELRQAHILVNAVCPGWVSTDMGGLVLLVLLRRAPRESCGQRHCPRMVPLVVSSATVSPYHGDTHVPEEETKEGSRAMLLDADE